MTTERLPQAIRVAGFKPLEVTLFSRRSSLEADSGSAPEALTVDHAAT